MTDADPHKQKLLAAEAALRQSNPECISGYLHAAKWCSSKEDIQTALTGLESALKLFAKSDIRKYLNSAELGSAKLGALENGTALGDNISALLKQNDSADDVLITSFDLARFNNAMGKSDFESAEKLGATLIGWIQYRATFGPIAGTGNCFHFAISIVMSMQAFARKYQERATPLIEKFISAVESKLGHHHYLLGLLFMAKAGCYLTPEDGVRELEQAVSIFRTTGKHVPEGVHVDLIKQLDATGKSAEARNLERTFEGKANAQRDNFLHALRDAARKPVTDDGADYLVRAADEHGVQFAPQLALVHLHIAEQRSNVNPQQRVRHLFNALEIMRNTMPEDLRDLHTAYERAGSVCAFLNQPDEASRCKAAAEQITELLALPKYR